MAIEEKMQVEEMEKPSDICLDERYRIPFSRDYCKEINIACEIANLLRVHFAKNAYLNFCKIREFVEIMR